MSDMKETDFPPPEPQPFVTEEGREIQRLRAELAAERETTVSLLRTIALIREAGGLAREDLDALPDAVRAMRQQRDEARRDAERYRWLKSGGCYWVEIQSQPSGDYIFRGQAARSIGGSIDNAIDAVLAAQKQGGGAC